MIAQVGGGGDTIRPLDLHRLMWGDAPPTFLFEIVVRVLVIYVWLVFWFKLVSRRTVSQLSVFEILLVIALGSAVGDGVLYADVPLTHALLVVLLVVMFERGMIHLMRVSDRFERLVEGEPRLVVEDGVMRPDDVRIAQMDREALFMLLRTKGYRHLGEVELAYAEQGGQLSVVRAEPPRPGLRVMPPWELTPPALLRAGQVATTGPLGCDRCGRVIDVDAGATLQPCTCGGLVWADGVVGPAREVVD